MGQSYGRASYEACELKLLAGNASLKLGVSGLV